MKGYRLFALRWIQALVILLAVIPFFAGCGGGGGSSGGNVPETPTGPLTGYIVDSRGGPPVAGSIVTITGSTDETLTTDAEGRFTAQVEDGTYDIVARKTGYAECRVQGLRMVNSTIPVTPFMIQPRAFNPDLPVEAPSISIAGIQEGTLSQGDVYNIVVTVEAANPVRLIELRVGSQNSTIDASASDSNTLEFTWDTTDFPVPPGQTYLHVSALDINFNRTYRIMRLVGPDVNSSLDAPDDAMALSFTFAEDIAEYANAQQLRSGPRKKDPYILDLPGGVRLDTRTVPPGAGIINRIEWNEVSGAGGYRIYRSNNSTTGFERIGDTLSGSWTLFNDPDPTLEPGTTYYYRVSAFNEDGEGEASLTPGVKVLDKFIVTLETPANGATNVSTTPTFSWNIVQSAGVHQVYEIYVLGYNDDDFTWIESDLQDVTSVESGAVLKPNTVYEWDLSVCTGVDSYYAPIDDFLSYSFASLNGSSSSGASLFTTTAP